MPPFLVRRSVNNGLLGAFRNANITLAICIAFMGGAVGAGIMGVATKLFGVTKAFDTFVNGMAELISVPFILVCAWSLGSIVKGMGTSEFLIHIVENYLTPGLVPALYSCLARSFPLQPAPPGVCGPL